MLYIEALQDRMIGRSSIATLAGYAIVVDAKGEQAQAFYEHFGFIGLPGTTRRLFYPVARIN